MCRGESTSSTFFHYPVRITRSCHCPRHLKLIAMERSLWQQHVVLCSTVGMKETPEEIHGLKVHTSQDTHAATLKCLFFTVHLHTMLTLQRSAWAPGISQLMSGQDSEFFVGLVVSEMLPDYHTSGSVPNNLLASSRLESQLGSIVPNDSIRLRDPSTRSNKQIVATCRDKTNQNKSTDGCVKPILTLSESILIKFTLRSIESALSISTAAWRIRTR